MEIPAKYTELYDAQQIQKRVAEVGCQITDWIAGASQAGRGDLLGIPVLRGGMFFFVDLVRQVKKSVEVAPIRAWGYDGKSNSALEDGVGVNLDFLNASGKSVLLVDDICDSGRTLQKLKTVLHDAGVSEVRSVVLVLRDSKECLFEPDFVCFTYPGKEWLVGYGMDDAERWRNLPSIYSMREE